MVSVERPIVEMTKRHDNLISIRPQALAFCGDQVGLRASEVLGQVVGVARFVEVLGAGHFFVGLTFGRVGQPEVASDLERVGFLAVVMLDLRGLAINWRPTVGLC